MKICPKCRAEFEEKFNFCLQDGTPLVDSGTFAGPDDEQETLTGGSKPPPDLAPDAESQSSADSSEPDVPQSAIRTEEWHAETSGTVDRETSDTSGAQTSDQQLVETRGQDETVERRSYLGLIVGIIAFLGFALLIFVAAGAYLIYRSQNQDQAATANTNQESNLNYPVNDSNENAPESITGSNTEAGNTNIKEEKKPTPSSSVTPKPVPTDSVPSPTPKPTSTPRRDTPVPTPTRIPTRTPTPIPTPARVSVPDRITGGVLNGKAISLPKPGYPAAARAVGARGVVRVAVTVGESGKVINARAVSGHPLLRGAAVSAARRAKFRPTLLRGRPVIVAGMIIYNFRP